jgi:processive 1,2-diacylglycerol beta-glucosyltransferase
MIALHDKETGAFLGTITEAQLQFLIDQLEEESRKDMDYYINRDTLDLFQEQGIDPTLLTFLQQALGTRSEMEIEWSRTERYT